MSNARRIDYNIDFLGGDVVQSFAEKVIHVSKSSTATDTRTGLSKYSSIRPFATLQAAGSAASAEDVVHVHPGTYVDNFILKTGVFLHLDDGVVLDGDSAPTVGDGGVAATGCGISGQGVIVRTLGGNSLDIGPGTSVEIVECLRIGNVQLTGAEIKTLRVSQSCGTVYIGGSAGTAISVGESPGPAAAISTMDVGSSGNISVVAGAGATVSVADVGNTGAGIGGNAWIESLRIRSGTPAITVTGGHGGDNNDTTSSTSAAASGGVAWITHLESVSLGDVTVSGGSGGSNTYYGNFTGAGGTGWITVLSALSGCGTLRILGGAPGTDASLEGRSGAGGSAYVDKCLGGNFTAVYCTAGDASEPGQYLFGAGGASAQLNYFHAASVGTFSVHGGAGGQANSATPLASAGGAGTVGPVRINGTVGAVEVHGGSGGYSTPGSAGGGGGGAASLESLFALRASSLSFIVGYDGGFSGGALYNGGIGGGSVVGTVRLEKGVTGTTTTTGAVITAIEVLGNMGAATINWGTIETFICGAYLASLTVVGRVGSDVWGSPGGTATNLGVIDAHTLGATNITGGVGSTGAGGGAVSLSQFIVRSVAGAITVVGGQGGNSTSEFPGYGGGEVTIRSAQLFGYSIGAIHLTGGAAGSTYSFSGGFGGAVSVDRITLTNAATSIHLTGGAPSAPFSGVLGTYGGAVTLALLENLFGETSVEVTGGSAGSSAADVAAGSDGATAMVSRVIGRIGNIVCTGGAGAPSVSGVNPGANGGWGLIQSLDVETCGNVTLTSGSDGADTASNNGYGAGGDVSVSEAVVRRSGGAILLQGGNRSIVNACSFVAKGGLWQSSQAVKLLNAGYWQVVFAKCAIKSTGSGKSAILLDGSTSASELFLDDVVLDSNSSATYGVTVANSGTATISASGYRTNKPLLHSSLTNSVVPIFGYESSVVKGY